MNHPAFVTRVDAAPAVFQYIGGLKVEELIIELIQNELDAHSTETSIQFQPTKLVCQGNGQNITDNGWKRLSYLMGAGDEVASKRSQIGVKNHGLKTCFRLGDEIKIRSDELLTIQTLYGDGYDQDPRPGTFERPIKDPNPIFTGTSIEVPYRTKTLSTTIGEPIEIPVVGPGFLEELFSGVCETLAKMIIGAIRPGKREKYVLTLSHHSLGSARYTFSSTVASRVGKYQHYSRKCIVKKSDGTYPAKYVEECFLLNVKKPIDLTRDIPEFYINRGGYFYSEISWPISQSRKPISGEGYKRYPLSYSRNSKAGKTGLGVSFSGPYYSDSERARAVENDKYNDLIDTCCIRALVTILKSHLIPRYGGQILDLLISIGEISDDDLIRTLILEMIAQKAVPLALPENRNSGYRNFKLIPPRNKRPPFGPRQDVDGDEVAIIIPCLSYKPDTFQKRLAFLCHDRANMIHPSIPSPIIKSLNSMINDEDIPIISFDEKDAIDRFQPEIETQFFQWNNEQEWIDELGNVIVSEQYLYLIHDLFLSKDIIEGKSIFETIKSMSGNAYLPDTQGMLRRKSDLFLASFLPPSLDMGGEYPLVNEQLSKHPLLRRASWKIPRLTLNSFFDMLDEMELNETLGRQLWTWVKNHSKKITPNYLRRLADYKIWPDLDNELHILSDLCWPNRKIVSTILDDFIFKPHSQIRTIPAIKKAKAGKYSLRKFPTEAEFESFVSEGMSGFEKELILSKSEVERFLEFERHLISFSRIPILKKYLNDLSLFSYTLNQLGALRGVEDIVVPGAEINKIGLHPKDIARHSNSSLYHIPAWKPLDYPNRSQLLDAIKYYPDNVSALTYRIKYYLKACTTETIEETSQDIKEIDCIPWEGEFIAPMNCAFSGNRDYWGDWKHKLTVKKLSANSQNLYTKIGVLPGTPSTTSSIEFFEWLNEQSELVIQNHLDCILRHLQHQDKSVDWFNQNYGLPCVPVIISKGHVELVSVSEIRRSQSPIFRNDFKPIVDQIQGNPQTPFKLTIQSHPKISKPIVTILKMLGVKSLKAKTDVPDSVEPVGDVFDAPHLVQILEHLQSRAVQRELQKRLTDLDLDIEVHALKHTWHEKLRKIANIKIAFQVSAVCKINRHFFEYEVNGGLDRISQILWISQNTDSIKTFYKQIVTIVFEESAEFLALVLENALMSKYTELSASLAAKSDRRGDATLPIQEEDENPESSGDLVHTKKTHKPEELDPDQNIPKPGDLTYNPKTQYPQQSQKSKPEKVEYSGSSRVHSAKEEHAKKLLKSEHYAYHCQACLTKKSISELAPIGSYVEFVPNRRKLIEAHHPDQVHAHGARDGGNLLILCQYHHHRYGDALTNSIITQQLRNNSKSMSIQFDLSGESAEVSGMIISFNETTLDEKIDLFFTIEHAKTWLNPPS